LVSQTAKVSTRRERTAVALESPSRFRPPEYIRRFSQFECNILIECNILKFPKHDKTLKFHNLISRI
jgi:hypothetical protein